jgi:hypothetical protein
VSPFLQGGRPSQNTCDAAANAAADAALVVAVAVVTGVVCVLLLLGYQKTEQRRQGWPQYWQ